MSQNLLYMLTNLIDGETITPSSENALFPKENLYAGFPSRTFRFDAAAADDQITIDFGAAETPTIVSIHGHNIDSGVTAIQLRASTDNFSGSDDLVGTFTKRDPAFYLVCSGSYRYWRIKFVGTNTGGPIEIGELFFADTATLSLDPRHHMEMTELRRQIRNRTRGGEMSVVNLSDFKEKDVRFYFRGSFTELEDIRDSLWDATEHGANACVIVPNDSRPEVIFGHLRQELGITRIYSDPTAGKEVHEYVMAIRESAFGASLTVST